MRTFDLPYTLAIRLLNEQVGRVLWYSEFKRLYIRAGGKKENTAKVLEELIAHFDAELKWRPRIGHGGFVTNDVEVLKRIDYC